MIIKSETRTSSSDWNSGSSAKHPLLKIGRWGIYIFLSLWAAFIAGALSDHAGWIEPIALKLEDLKPETFRSYLRSISAKPEQLVIDIKYKDYQWLAYRRELALDRGVITTEDDSYVPATIRTLSATAKAKIRLKGDYPDHLEGDKWSLRIKIKGDDAIMGMRQFSIQNPKRSGWINEWLVHELLRYEGLIALKYDFVNVGINGTDMGIYAIEESFSKELLARNKRREGPIIKFDETNQIDRSKVSLGDYRSELDIFHAADIVSFNATKTYKDEKLKNDFLVARHLLSEFRLKKKSVHQVFDVDKTARLFALIDLLQAEHALRWKNIRFYFNPITQRLEPIAYNAYTQSPSITRLHKLSYQPWNEKEKTNNNYKWMDLFYKDKKFVARYIRELDRISSPGHIEKFFQAIQGTMDQKIAIIHKDNPEIKLNNRVHIHNRNKIRELLHPRVPLKVYIKDKQKNSNGLVIDVANTGFLPVQLHDIECEKGNKKTQRLYPTILAGKVTRKPLKLIKVSAQLEDAGTMGCLNRITRHGRNLVLDGAVLTYQVIGTQEKRKALIGAYPIKYSGEIFSRVDQNTNGYQSLVGLGRARVHHEKQQIIFDRGEHIVDRNLVVPNDYELIFNSGALVDLRNGASIISFSPIKSLGTVKQPVVITSSNSSGGGIAIMKAKNRSDIKHTIIKNLAAPSTKTWGLTGAVTFYESEVSIAHSRFNGSRAEDALNIVRSNFEIKQSTFDHSRSDALDTDFSDGRLVNSKFHYCGNDCVDTSGGTILMESVVIDSASDKGISVGEASNVSIKNVQIANAEFAVVSKDNSHISADGIKLLNNVYSFVAYTKKKEFGAASIVVKNLTGGNTIPPYLLEPSSNIVINGNTLSPNSRNLKRHIYTTEKL